MKVTNDYIQAPKVMEFLDAIEEAHKGKTFCYCSVPFNGTVGVCQIAVVRNDEDGYYPVSEDYFVGTDKEMRETADKLNDLRLKMGPHEAALIVADSMSLHRRGHS